MNRIRNIKKFITLITLTTLFLVCLFPTISSKDITTFENDGGVPDLGYEIIIGEQSEIGVEAKGYFTIPDHRGAIKNATLNIECRPDKNGNYLTDPRLDIGLDGDYEWEFNEKGYGKAGNQNVFSTGMDKRVVMTARHGASNFDKSTYILLPKEAQVTNASMKIKGGTGTYDEDCFVAVDFYGYNIYYIGSNGDGTFKTPISFDTNVGRYHYGAICTADFDNDGDLDVIASNGGSGDIYFYEKIGAGASFAPKVSVGKISTSWYMYHFAAGDFTNDANYDFIVSGSSSTIYLFKGDGKGQFTMTTISATGGPSLPWGKDAADINNDGNLDFVCGHQSSANRYSFYYYQGNGDGTFQNAAKINSPSTYYTYNIITDDFDNDGNVDVITAYSSGMYYFKGNGDGTFGPSTYLMSPGSYPGGDAYDYDGDGNVDLMITQRATTSTAKYYKGNGNFGFAYISTPGNIGTYTWSGKAPPRKPLGGCENLTVDIGDDGGTPEMQFANEFYMEETIYFTNSLNALLGNARSRGLEVVTDEYGNEMCKIPLRFGSDTLGSVLLFDLDIKYTYIAKVNLLPDERFNLTTDLNDLLPVNSNVTSETEVYLAMYSNTPGKVILSGLHIEYNGAPECKGISTQSVAEHSVKRVLNLTKHFTDDYDVGIDMTYGVYKNGDPEHVMLSITEDNWLEVDTSVVPNWHGSTSAIVWCRDTDGIETRSNEFKLTIMPVDDPPEPYNPLPNIELKENETKTPIDLDEPKMEYFIDVDSNTLYYRAMLISPEEDGDHVEVEVLPVSNKLRVRSIGTYRRNIGVRVYCDDDISLLTMSISELESFVTSYQTLLINITTGSNTFPPQWLDIPFFSIHEDEPNVNYLRLSDYVIDEDDILNNLSFSIHSLTYSGYIDIIIDEETSYLSIYPRDDFDGTAKVTLAVTDDEQNRDLTTVDIKIIPNNDQPIVKISEPGNGTQVRGVVEIIGSAYDPEDELSKVEIAIGESGSWTPVSGLSYWTYEFDTNEFDISLNRLLVKVRAEDESGSQSLLDKIYLLLKATKEDTDGDGVPDLSDKFPTNPSEWSDRDGDGLGDNQDKFPNDATQWLDTDGDGYGNNLHGNQEDKFPYDPTQWQDTDGDGHGDNEWGNNGDFYPYDPELSLKKDTESTGTSKSDDAKADQSYLSLMIILIVIVIITILIIINYIVVRKKNRKNENLNQMKKQ